MNNELMNNEFFKSLPEEVKKKLKNCKSEEEAMDILRDNMIEIPAGELKKISGGINWDPCDNRNCHTGDSREETALDGSISRDFEEGRLTGADFFDSCIS